MSACSGGETPPFEELGLSVFSALESLCKENSHCPQRLNQFLSLQIWNTSHRQSLLEILVELFIDPDATDDIAFSFSPLLLEIVLRATSRSGNEDPAFNDRLVVALSRACYRRPDVDGVARKFLQTNHRFGPFTLSHSTETPDKPVAKRPKSGVPLVGDLETLKAALRFLLHDFDFYSNLWDWSPVQGFLKHVEPRVRWAAIDILAYLYQFSPDARETLRDRHVSKTEAAEFKMEDAISRGQISKNLKRCWVDPNLVDAKPMIYTQHAIVAADLSNATVSVKGVLLEKMNEDNATTSDDSLCQVPSTRRNLQKIALAVADGRAVLVEGASGFGKTTLIEHLARLTGRRKSPALTKIQLGEQTDSKMLIGTYACTDVPGKFVWQPGTLTQAVTQGHWVLLEDIDAAPSDVLAILRPLLASGTLTIPGRGDVLKTGPGFQIFATSRGFASWRGFNSPDWSKMFCTIGLDPLLQEELRDIVCELQPNLSDIVDKLLEIFYSISSTQSGVAQRSLSNRDFLKWCSRLADAKRDNVAQSAFHHAVDVFCGSLPSVQKARLANEIGIALNMNQGAVDFFLHSRRPDVQHSTQEGVFRVGSQGIEIKESEHVTLEYSRAFFAYTRPSLVLLEQISIAVSRYEPVLLVGETGVGKTSSIQFLAQQTGRTLKVINMNQHSDSNDLLGGYKPTSLHHVVLPVKKDFENLFCRTFSREHNVKFLSHIQDCFSKKRWSSLCKLMGHSLRSAMAKIDKNLETFACVNADDYVLLRKEWGFFSERLKTLDEQINHSGRCAISFSFVEGTLIRAIRNGWWLLLDEVNLATSETLECLSGVLENRCGSVLLLEKGDIVPVERHPDFRIFACMNPATDVGKKELPVGIRNRFTELFVDEIETELDLMTLSAEYLKGVSLPSIVHKGLVKFYLDIKRKASKSLTDIEGNKPHYSLRTLCRALRLASTNRYGHPLRSLYESFCLSFLTTLDRLSRPIVMEMVSNAIMNATKSWKSVLKQPLPEPLFDGTAHVLVEDYWLRKGQQESRWDELYIITDSVRANLKDLSRVVSACSFPVLIQGETSVGKTSLIQYLADASGNKCLRINNHEHTDIQEYVGSYGADPDTGALVYQEGVLVEAMRKGHWVILDELNLAPTDVLEALNRLLDDNRELFIPETQETVKAHPMFMLFATQNPPGTYGGRKVLSRAFRNRFVEIHFDEIPPHELEVILEKKCSLPGSYCKKLVGSMQELQRRRCSTEVFSGKRGFMTLRDLFRWAERYRRADENPAEYDWEQHLADHGYLLLAGRVRKIDDELTILNVIHKYFKRKVEPKERLFSLSQKTSSISRKILEAVYGSDKLDDFRHIVWTYNLRRLAVLVGIAMEYNEPALVVGETGCGKTTVCQLLSRVQNKQLDVLNCHLNTETADFLGGLRPVRSRPKAEEHRLFEWVDGPLVIAMTTGTHFLVDEISLADDSVLERLNSLLEPQRSILLAEKGVSNKELEIITAQDDFRLIATMNPGGDYGKKELSPALRNRFTEIWCPQLDSTEDIIHIVKHNSCNTLTSFCVGKKIGEFCEWLSTNGLIRQKMLSVRDILKWVRLMNKMILDIPDTKPEEAYLHGASIVFLDGIDSTTKVNDLTGLKELCTRFLLEQVHIQQDFFQKLLLNPLISSEDWFGIFPFCVKKNKLKSDTMSPKFSFTSPTPFKNTYRVLRALQIERPIMLEGSPGVGKTSLVAAIAAQIGKKLVRINLSEQTDISDLFGADLPVEGGSVGQFQWIDGPFLKALKCGHWIVLDELNLASQSVLEGLNACLDHRGEVFIPELGKTFQLSNSQTVIFACQNPMNEGGGRKGLPKSFLNRFIQVFTDSLELNDYEGILAEQFLCIPRKLIKKMVQFNQEIAYQFSENFVKWEFNLRDLSRWCSLLLKHQSSPNFDPAHFVNLVYLNRISNPECRSKAVSLFKSIFKTSNDFCLQPPRDYLITPSFFQAGHAMLLRKGLQPICDNIRLLPHSIPVLESVMHCVIMNWVPILVGGSNGKSTVIEMLAKVLGHHLLVFSMNSAVDTTELLGGFEQYDSNRHFNNLRARLKKCVENFFKTSLIQGLNFTQFYSNPKDYHGCLKMINLMKSFNPQDETFVQLLEMETEICSINSVANRTGTFEWIDSVLVKAMKNGDWILLDDVNLCNPSVLDRLNAYLEPNGFLAIHERGFSTGFNSEEYIIQTHPNFRMFLTMDGNFGELSRAMRNRVLEIDILNQGSLGEEDIFNILHSVFQQNPTKGFTFPQTSLPSISASSIIQIGSEINNKMIHGLLDHCNDKITSFESIIGEIFKYDSDRMEKTFPAVGKPDDFIFYLWPTVKDLVDNPDGITVENQACYINHLSEFLERFNENSLIIMEELKTFSMACILFLNLQSNSDRFLRLFKLRKINDKILIFANRILQSQSLSLSHCGVYSVSALHKITFSNIISGDSSPISHFDLNQIPMDPRLYPQLSYILNWELLQSSRVLFEIYVENTVTFNNKFLLLSFVSVIENGLQQILSNVSTHDDIDHLHLPLLASYQLHFRLIAYNDFPETVKKLYPFLVSMLSTLKDVAQRACLCDEGFYLYFAVLIALETLIQESLKPVNISNDQYSLNLILLRINNLIDRCPNRKSFPKTILSDFQDNTLFTTSREVVGHPVPFQNSDQELLVKKIFELKEFFTFNVPKIFKNKNMLHPRFIAFKTTMYPEIFEQLKKLCSIHPEYETENLLLLEESLSNRGFFKLNISDEAMLIPNPAIISKINLWKVTDHFLLLENLENLLEPKGLENSFEKLQLCVSPLWNVPHEEDSKKFEILRCFLSILNSWHKKTWINLDKPFNNENEFSENQEEFLFPDSSLHPFLHAVLSADIFTLLKGKVAGGNWLLTSVPIKSFESKLEELDNLKSLLQSHGVIVGRPPLDILKICKTLLFTICKILDKDFIFESDDVYDLINFLTRENSQLIAFEDFSEVFSKLGKLTYEHTETYYQLIIMSSILLVHLLTPNVDPVVSLKEKIDYREKMLEKVLLALKSLHATFRIKKGDLNSLYHHHSHIVQLTKWKSILETEIKDFKRYLGYRPKFPNFFSLKEKLTHNKATLSHPNVVSTVMNSRDVARVKTWLDSQLMYICDLKKDFFIFQDVVNPIAEYLSIAVFFQHLYFCWRVKTSNCSFPNISSVVQIISFPHKVDSYGLTLQSRLQSTKQIIQESFSSHEENVQKLFFPALRSHILLSLYSFKIGYFKDEHIFYGLNCFQKVWNADQIRLDKKIKEETDFFKYKNPIDGFYDSDDLALYFPTYMNEFNDFVDDSEVNEKCVQYKSEIFALDYSDIHLFVNAFYNMIEYSHKEVIYPEWLDPFLQKPITNTIDTSKKALQIYLCHSAEFLQSLLEESLSNSDYSYNKQIVGLSIFLADSCHKSLKSASSDRVKHQDHFDIYIDPYPDEAQNILPILKTSNKAIDELLQEFPDHPVLQLIQKIIQRIMQFSLDSPIIKFLTGLELLAAKISSWNQNASKHVSLNTVLELIQSLVVKWRKLELHQWENSLNMIKNKINLNSKKWWFYLNKSFEEFITDHDVSDDKLILTLKKFMETALIGDFSERSKLIYSFHKKFFNLHCQQQYNDKCFKLATILGNIASHYFRFSNIIEQQMKKLISPIEDNLKSFVKIIKWSDMNYWALKETTFKTHRYLLSQMRAFQNVLSQPVQQFLQINLEDSIFELACAKTFRPHYDLSTFSLSRDLLSKMTYFIQEVFHFKGIDQKIEALNDDIGNIIERSASLRAMKISEGMDKEKRLKESKYILKQKETALTSLFHYLKSIDLSYLKGLVLSRMEQNDFMLMPLICIENKNGITQQITSCLKECQKYHFSSVSLLPGFQNNLSNPSKDIKASSVERIKGYILHLNHFVLLARDILVKQGKACEELLTLNRSIFIIKESQNHGHAVKTQMLVPPQDEMKTHAVDTKEILIDSVDSLIQFNTIFDSYDSNCSGNFIKDSLFELLETVIELNKSKILNENTVFGWQNFQELQEMHVSFDHIISKLELIHCKLNQTDEFTQLINHLCNKLKRRRDSFQSWCDAVLNHGDTYYSEYSNDDGNEYTFSELQTNVLKIVEKLYKIGDKNQKNLPENVSLSYVVTYLHQLEDIMYESPVVNKLTRLLSVASCNSSHKINHALNILIDLYPFVAVLGKAMENFYLFIAATYRAFAKLLYILLCIMTEVITKGFCKPEDFENDPAEGESKSVEGMGLGDGDVSGAKDVSEEITSEDQLEEALQRNQDRKNTEQPMDIPQDEEDGIEMTEDFDAGLDNVKNNEENTDNNEENDLEKQMGDVGEIENGEETLDNELWGDQVINDDVGETESKGKNYSNDELIAKDDNQINENDKDDLRDPSNDQKEELPCDLRDFSDNENENVAEPIRNGEEFDLPNDLNLDIDHADNENDDVAAAEEDTRLDPYSDDEGEKINEDIVEGENESSNGPDESNNDDLNEIDSDDKNVKENYLDSVEDDPTCTSQEKSDESNKTDVSSDLKSVLQSAFDSGHSKTEDLGKHDVIGQEENSAVSNDEEVPESSNIGFSQSKSIGKQAIQEFVSPSDNIESQQEGETKSNKPGTIDERRNIATQINKPTIQNHLNILDIDHSLRSVENKPIENYESQTYKHILESEEIWDAEARDASTLKQQIESRKNHATPDVLEDIKDEKKKQELNNKPETLSATDTPLSSNTSGKDANDLTTMSKTDEDPMDLDVEPKSELPIQKPEKLESVFFSKFEFNIMENQRLELSNELVLFYNKNRTGQDSVSLWSRINNVTNKMSNELCEELRLILEPTEATKLKGDYRSGKRINMRKVIPYIASDFRKDKIWLRRTKPSKRNYQIMIALDDSGSMSDNDSKQMAFESLGVITNALMRLEAGEISIASFGEATTLLHPFDKPFSNEAGAEVLNQLTFTQKKTYFAKVLNQILPQFLKSKNHKSHRTVETSQLLIIVSDGRGLFSEGVEKVNSAVRRCCQAGLFIVFIIIDNPTHKDSIYDIRIPIFSEKSALPVFKPYLDCFPFPFYLVLKDITHLPGILSQALRQWFEMVAAVDR